MSVRSVLAGVVFSLAVTGVARADDAPPPATVYTSTTGTFTEVFKAAGDTNPTYTGLGTTLLTYGDDNGGLGAKSRLYFAPAIDYGDLGDFRGVYNGEEPFFLGTLFFFNGATVTGTSISGVTLSLFTELTEAVNPAGDGFGTLDELIYITSTPNSGTAEENADYISFASLGLSAHVLEGKEAGFNLYGTLNSPLTITQLLATDANGFVSEAAPGNINVAAVPEPGAWALMIAGFGAAGAMLRRRRSAVVA